jgi:hypothetical protein
VAEWLRRQIKVLVTKVARVRTPSGSHDLFFCNFYHCTPNVFSVVHMLMLISSGNLLIELRAPELMSQSTSFLHLRSTSSERGRLMHLELQSAV